MAMFQLTGLSNNKLESFVFLKHVKLYLVRYNNNTV